MFREVFASGCERMDRELYIFEYNSSELEVLNVLHQDPLRLYFADRL